MDASAATIVARVLMSSCLDAAKNAPPESYKFPWRHGYFIPVQVYSIYVFRRPKSKYSSSASNIFYEYTTTIIIVLVIV